MRGCVRGMRKKLLLLVSVIALMFIITACGGSDNNAAEETNEANATDLTLIATNWDFDQDEYVVKAGEPINFALENAEGHHTYAVRGLGIDIGPNETKQFTIHEPGEYEIFCSTMCGAGHDD